MDQSPDEMEFHFNLLLAPRRATELFNDWGGRGYDDSVPREVTKTARSRDRTT